MAQSREDQSKTARSSIARPSLRVKDLGVWLRQGWRMFNASRRVCILYAAIPMALGTLLQTWLAGRGFGLVFFLFATGFVIFAPVLAVAFYRIAEVLEEGGRPGWGEITTAFRRSPAAVWAVGLVLAALYLIWITDALIIYSVYFSFDPIELTEYFSDDRIGGEAASFLLYSSILGLVLSFAAFTVGAFSVPHALSTGAGLVGAVVFSVAGVFRNFGVMMVWASVLALVQAVTLLFVMPVGLVVFPVLALANAAAYRQLVAVGGPGNTS